MKNNNKKYNHYVPKFYLRFFSPNKKSVGVYIFENEKKLLRASLNSVGGYNYLYGQDGSLEEWFRNLERQWNAILKKIIETRTFDINDEEYTLLLMFVYLSEARSLRKADEINDFINYLMITIWNTNNIKKINYDTTIVKNTIPNLYSINNIRDVLPVLFDLKFVLILNQTSSQFITSDCIVNIYNQFLIEKGFKRGYGYGSIGIQIFIPISPYCCLCLYDHKIYDAKVKNDIIIIKNQKEINKMNELFLYNSYKYIFFHENINKSKLNILLKNKKRLNKENCSKIKSKDGKYILKFNFKTIDKNFNLTFFKIKNNANKIVLNKNMTAPNRSMAIKNLNTTNLNK